MPASPPNIVERLILAGFDRAWKVVNVFWNVVDKALLRVQHRAERVLLTMPWRWQESFLLYLQVRTSDPRYLQRTMALHQVMIGVWLAVSLGIVWVWTQLNFGVYPPSLNAWFPLLQLIVLTLGSLFSLGGVTTALSLGRHPGNADQTIFEAWLLRTLTDPAFENKRAQARGQGLARQLPEANRAPAKRTRL